MLALVPLIDYEGWRKATDRVPGEQLVQASVTWAYQVLQDKNASFRCAAGSIWWLMLQDRNASFRCATGSIQLVGGRRVSGVH